MSEVVECICEEPRQKNIDNKQAISLNNPRGLMKWLAFINIRNYPLYPFV